MAIADPLVEGEESEATTSLPTLEKDWRFQFFPHFHQKVKNVKLHRTKNSTKFHFRNTEIQCSSHETCFPGSSALHLAGCRRAGLLGCEAA